MSPKIQPLLASLLKRLSVSMHRNDPPPKNLQVIVDVDANQSQRLCDYLGQGSAEIIKCNPDQIEVRINPTSIESIAILDYVRNIRLARLHTMH